MDLLRCLDHSTPPKPEPRERMIPVQRWSQLCLPIDEGNSRRMHPRIETSTCSSAVFHYGTSSFRPNFLYTLPAINCPAPHAWIELSKMDAWAGINLSDKELRNPVISRPEYIQKGQETRRGNKRREMAMLEFLQEQAYVFPSYIYIPLYPRSSSSGSELESSMEPWSQRYFGLNAEHAASLCSNNCISDNPEKRKQKNAAMDVHL